MPRGVPAEFPSHQQLRHWERVCQFLDSQPYRAVAHPFPTEPPMSVKLFDRMYQYKLVKHFKRDCTYRLSAKWREILHRLWKQLPEEDSPQKSLPLLGDPFVVDTNVDTFYVTLLTPIADEDDEESRRFLRLPVALQEACTHLKERAQLDDGDVETPWSAFDTPLNMLKSGVGTGSKKKGISWSFLLRNAYLMVRLRKTSLSQMLASVRISAECLWTYGPRGALDGAKEALRLMWGDDQHFREMTWQVSQIHLCADIANFSPRPEDLDRVVTYSRKKAIHVPSLDDEATTIPYDEDIDDFLSLPPDGWDDLSSADFDEGANNEEDEEAEDDDETPADEDRAAVYLYGQRVSGFAFSPGAPLSAAWYNKELEERLSGKIWMRPIHEAGGWKPHMPLFRIEARFSREILREFGISWVDDPWQILEHLNDLWAYYAGLPPEHDLAPDATHRGWMRLTKVANEDTNRNSWPTAPVWEVVQRASFDQDAPPVPLKRQAQVVHDPDQIDAEIYGLLKLRSVIWGSYQDESLTLSLELRAFAQRMEQWDELRNRDYSEEVRDKARTLGRGVPLKTSSILPFGAASQKKHA